MPRIICVALILLCGVSSSGGERGTATFLFDMGTDQSEVRPGFTRVTAQSLYSTDAGYGWKSVEGLKEHYRHYGREWSRDESRGEDLPPPIYTNEVTCDCVRSDRSNQFLIDLPPGDYALWLLAGLSAGSDREVHDFDVSVTGGEERCQYTFKIPGPFTFEKRLVRVSVRDGQLSIDLHPRTDWMLTAVVVFPASDESSVRKQVLDALENEIFFLPPDVAEKWQQTKHVDDRPLPEWNAAERSRGYAIFARHWSEIVYPNTVPRPDELNPSLKVFASLGEYEPVTFTVFPLEDLEAAEVVADDLRCGDSVIPKANIDVRQVRYMLVRPNYSTYFSYHVAPDVLERTGPSHIARGCNQRYWMTIKVPEEAEPGVYSGSLAFRAAGRQSADIPLRVRVLPIRLQQNPHHIYGMYYRDPLSAIHDNNSSLANEYFARKADLERQDMVAHGMNTHISGVSGLDRDEQGNWSMDGAETERRIALDRKYGLAGHPLVVSFPVGWWYSKLVDQRGLGSHLRLVRPDVPPSFFDEVTRMVEAIEREKKKYDWPEFLYYPIDEPSTHADSVRFMTEVLKAIKRVPGARTYVTADPSHEQFQPLWPYVDVWCCQPFVFGHEKIRQLSADRNIEFWCYPNHISGENDHTPVRGARMTWGFGFWKSGFRTLIPWIYQASIGDPWNYLDGTAMDFFNRSTPDGEPIPVTLWEAYREGIDDGRYLYTLQQLTDACERRGGPVSALAAEAKRELKHVWESIEVQEKYKFDGLWSGPDFDAFRWLLASRILALQQALTGEPAA